MIETQDTQEPISDQQQLDQLSAQYSNLHILVNSMSQALALPISGGDLDCLVPQVRALLCTILGITDDDLDQRIASEAKLYDLIRLRGLMRRAMAGNIFGSYLDLSVLPGQALSQLYFFTWICWMNARIKIIETHQSIPWYRSIFGKKLRTLLGDEK